MGGGYRGGEVECATGDYGFKLEFAASAQLNILEVKHKGKVYICESSLPLVISIVDKHTGTNASGGSNHMWNGPINGDFGGPFVAEVTANLFQDKNEITFEFNDDNNSQHKLKLTLVKVNSNNMTLDENKTRRQSLFSFDDNNFSSYPYFGSGIPWKFMSRNEDDIFVIDNKIKNIESVIFQDTPVNAFDYSSTGLEVTISQVLPGLDDPFTNAVHACTDIHLFNTNTYPSQTLLINVYTLADTDDDKINYCPTDGSLLPDCTTPISDPNHDCIDVGPDGTLDLFADLSYWATNLQKPAKPRDEWVWTNGNNDQANTLRLKPSVTPILTNPYYCNSVPLPNNTDTPPSMPDLSVYEAKLNDLYNKVGVNIVLADQGTLYTNIDSGKDDGHISSLREQIYLHASIFGYISPNDDLLNTPLTTELWLASDILNSSPNSTGRSLGRATGDPNEFLSFNTFSLNAHFPDSDLHYTALHELGHAKYNLWHPDDNGGVQGDNLSSPVQNDSQYNFMHSNVNRTIPIKDFRVRKYQWTKIKQ